MIMQFLHWSEEPALEASNSLHRARIQQCCRVHNRYIHHHQYMMHVGYCNQGRNCTRCNHLHPIHSRLCYGGMKL